MDPDQLFGFVVAKFGITLRQFLRIQGKDGDQSGVSLGIGIAFMVVGMLMAPVALAHYNNTRRLQSGQFQPAGVVIAILGVLTGLFGAILVAYLVYTAGRF